MQTQPQSPRKDESPQCTVVSLVPYDIFEEKPGLIPGCFRISASKNWSPQVLVVGECMFHVYIDEHRGYMQIYTPSHKVAHSIVQDYLDGQLERIPDVCEPGMFWVQGSYTAEEIEKKFVVELLSAKKRQKEWYLALVKLADNDWVQTGGKHIGISDIQRFAAKELGYKRDWIMDIPVQLEPVKTMNCPACQTTVSEKSIVCASCKCILKPVEFEKLKFAKV